MSNVRYQEFSGATWQYVEKASNGIRCKLIKDPRKVFDLVLVGETAIMPEKDWDEAISETIDQRRDRAVQALIEAGFDKNEFIVAVHRESEDDDTAFEYEWFIDAGDKDIALTKSMIGRHMYEELRFQSQAFYGDERCPECGDQRFGADREPYKDDTLRMRFFYRCMNCGHEQENKA